MPPKPPRLNIQRRTKQHDEAQEAPPRDTSSPEDTMQTSTPAPVRAISKSSSAQHRILLHPAIRPSIEGGTQQESALRTSTTDKVTAPKTSGQGKEGRLSDPSGVTISMTSETEDSPGDTHVDKGDIGMEVEQRMTSDTGDVL